jgi:phosphatidate cytidylyltransferase
VCSDVGGYVFGKIFKWKKLTKISPRKTLSGVFGSFIFNLLSF